MMAGKTIYQVKTSVPGTGARCSTREEAERAAEALKRAGRKGVRIVVKVVR